MTLLNLLVLSVFVNLCVKINTIPNKDIKHFNLQKIINISNSNSFNLVTIDNSFGSKIIKRPGTMYNYSYLHPNTHDPRTFSSKIPPSSLPCLNFDEYSAENIPCIQT